MTTSVSIEIPREVLHVTRMTALDLKRELAITLFQQSKLSFGKARELAEMSVTEFQNLLGTRKIPVHYDIPEYEKDVETLRRLTET